MDGDGIADLIQCSGDGTEYHWTLHHWTPAGPGFEKAALSGPDILGIYPCDTELYTVDVDADGKVDLVVRETNVIDDNNGSKTIRLNNYLAFSTSTMTCGSDQPQAPAPGLAGFVFLDVNGDGRLAVETGLAINSPHDDQHGHRFATPVRSLRDTVPGADQYAHLAVPIDYDADGLQDLLMPMALHGFGAPVWAVLHSTGTVAKGTFRIVETSIPFDATYLDSTVNLSDPHGPRVWTWTAMGRRYPAPIRIFQCLPQQRRPIKRVMPSGHGGRTAGADERGHCRCLDHAYEPHRRRSKGCAAGRRGGIRTIISPTMILVPTAHTRSGVWSERGAWSAIMR
jgi:hypothetical protein